MENSFRRSSIKERNLTVWSQDNIRIEATGTETVIRKRKDEEIEHYGLRTGPRCNEKGAVGKGGPLKRTFCASNRARYKIHKWNPWSKRTKDIS